MVSSQAAGLAVHESAVRKISVRRVWRLASTLFYGLSIPLMSHRYQQAAAANKHFAGHFLPAAGNVWDGKLNNVGSNGDYWSSTPNDENNAYNLNFNSGNANWNNWNNNNHNELTVRPVR